MKRPLGSEYGTTAWTVTARKRFRCQDHGDRVVMPGERYARLVAFPGSEVVSGDRPWVLKICRSCATRYGRPMPPTMAERRAELIMKVRVTRENTAPGDLRGER